VRSTITLDDDVAAALKLEMRKSGRAFKQVVNDTLRLGLPTLEKTEDYIEFLEGPDHR
jgi:hypothetical protein